MTHKKCVSCHKVKPVENFGKNAARANGLQTHCKVCRKNVAIKKRRLEQAQFDEDIEVAAIKKRQRSGHQKHYWLPPGSTGAERLHNFLCYRPVDEAAVLDTVKTALAELRREWVSSGRQVPPDPLGFDFKGVMARLRHEWS